MSTLSAELARLPSMTVKQLKARYAEVFGEETNGSHKVWLVRRIAWRLQALAEGDISERAKKRAEELACDADLRLNPPKAQASTRPPKQAAVVAPAPALHDARLPPPGSTLRRLYKGKQVEVLVLQDGFEYQGQVYASLSAVAKTICGAHVNGFHFFKLTKENG